ncbi:MAG TPA: hypothetical protein VEW42_06625 [Candidatus Eisenbacteria bacterium]|nr:hypothetical protein [Candidatus Eisenbacteria bacterium]
MPRTDLLHQATRASYSHIYKFNLQNEPIGNNPIFLDDNEFTSLGGKLVQDLGDNGGSISDTSGTQVKHAPVGGEAEAFSESGLSRILIRPQGLRRSRR